MRWYRLVCIPCISSVAFNSPFGELKFPLVTSGAIRSSTRTQRLPRSRSLVGRNGFSYYTRKHKCRSLDDQDMSLEIYGNHDREHEDKQRVDESSRGALARLKSYGLAGVIAYGLLNQLYYSAAFAFLWLGPMGAVAITSMTNGLGATISASAKQFGKVAALIWLGSQATKPVRITLALLLTPVAEVVLQATERRLNLPSRRYAFWTLFALILATTATFCATTVAYAALRAVTLAPTGSPPVSAAALLLLSNFGRPRDPAYRCGGGCLMRGEGNDYFYGATGRNVAPAPACWQSRSYSVMDNKAQLVWGGSTVGLQAKRGEKVSTVGVSLTKEAGLFLGGGEQSGGRISPQKIADKNPPPQDNVHGWKEHPNHLLGLWRVGDAEALPAPDESWADEAIAAAAPSLAAAEAITAAAAAAAHDSSAQGTHPENESHSSQLEKGGYGSREKANRDMVDFGSDVLHHVRYVVLRRGGNLKAGPADLGVAPRSWRFTPANRRLVFEVDVPGRAVTLRYSGKIKRLPGRFTKASGIVRVRPITHASGHKEMPPSSRLWPKLVSFTMEKDQPNKAGRRKRALAKSTEEAEGVQPHR